MNSVQCIHPEIQRTTTCPLKVPLLVKDLDTHIIQCYLVPQLSLPSNGFSIGSAVFAQLTCPTHTPHYVQRVYQRAASTLCMQAMRPKKSRDVSAAANEQA